MYCLECIADVPFVSNMQAHYGTVLCENAREFLSISLSTRQLQLQRVRVDQTVKTRILALDKLTCDISVHLV